MESHNYESFITNTVESMLPRFSYSGICLTMIINMSWTDYGYDEDGNTKVREESRYDRKVLLVFHRPSNYTKVLFKDVTDENFILGNRELVMKQLSDHDSCWRSDGMSWVFETFCKAWNFFEERGVEGRDIDPMVGYYLFNGNPSYYRIQLERTDLNDHYNSDYNVKIGEKIPLHKVSDFMNDPDDPEKLWRLKREEG